MAGRIVKDDIDALRAQADIVAVVGEYTTLKRAGRSFKGLCPFHTEKTPSFTVTPDGNFYNCFGCGVSGDLYDFLMRIEGLEFPEAVEALARRTGFQLRYEQMSARERRAVGERSRLVAATAAARDFLVAQLFADQGKVARDYLRARGFSRADAEAFEVGFAPNRFDAMSRALTADGIPEQDLIATGLVARNERGGLRDRFRGRLMFPIHDPGGDVIGFGGRILPDLDYGGFEPPKYLNSAETPLYKKTRVLYGIRQARSEIVRAEQVLVCEGYTDVMALHQAGVANAVATCGTAVGVEHLRMLARYAQRVVLAFDADAAGVKAAERAWEAARELSGEGQGPRLDLRVLVLPDGTDPADLVGEVGAAGVRDALDAATPVVPFVLRHHLGDADLTSEAGRTAALRDALTVLGRETDPDLRREWARTEIAERIGYAYGFVTETATRLGVQLDAHEGVATGGPEAGAPSGDDAARRGGAGGGRSLTAARARLERAALRALLQHPDHLPGEAAELVEDDLSHPDARAVLRAVRAGGGAGAPLEAVLEAAEDDRIRGLLRALALEEDPETADPELLGEVVAGRIRRLLVDRVDAETKALRDELARLSHTTEPERVRQLQRDLATLQQRRRTLLGQPV
ncbi:MAG: DNA primase [Nitriliruptoraceae bacterium]